MLYYKADNSVYLYKLKEGGSQRSKMVETILSLAVYRTGYWLYSAVPTIWNDTDVFDLENYQTHAWLGTVVH